MKSRHCLLWRLSDKLSRYHFSLWTRKTRCKFIHGRYSEFITRSHSSLRIFMWILKILWLIRRVALYGLMTKEVGSWNNTWIALLFLIILRPNLFSHVYSHPIFASENESHSQLKRWKSKGKLKVSERGARVSQNFVFPPFAPPRFLCFLMHHAIGTLARALYNTHFAKNALSKSFNQCTCSGDLKIIETQL